MSQIDNHLQWCLNDENRLKRIKPDSELAKKHLEKSEYNAEVMRLLEEHNKYDWALNVGFYAIYHCFLGILAYKGYASKNQSCTITVLIKLIDEGKINLEDPISKYIPGFANTPEKEKAKIIHLLTYTLDYDVPGGSKFSGSKENPSYINTSESYKGKKNTIFCIDFKR